jgi:HD-GYP domain-containing protein (c-di-GMP phosphodiesterase class II)
MTDDLLKAHSQLQRSYLNTIRSLAQALEAKDFYTRGHSERVTEYAMGIAGQMGLPAGEIELLREVCVLHDIGKIGIPENILTKNSPLTPEEWSVMKTHPEIGEAILQPIDFIRDGLAIVKQHHERPDGNGYPLGLKGNEISLLASITAVADTFDAMTTDRPYRKGLSQEEAIAALRENKGGQFASEPVDAFIRFLQKRS